jgi:hypothetical protein
MIEKEDFEAWQANPVTVAVFRALAAKAEEAKQKWLSASWQGGRPDPLLLADLRARAEIATDIVNLSHEDLEAILEA